MHPEVDKVKATTAPTYYLRFFASLFSATLSLSLYLVPTSNLEHQSEFREIN